MPPKADRGTKCPAPGCSVRLGAATKATCKQCKKDFCKDHSYPSDHECMRLSGGMSRSASAPQLVKQPQPSLGVLVSTGAAKAPVAAVAAPKVRECVSTRPAARRSRGVHSWLTAHQANGAATPAAPPATAVLKELQAADSQKLLDTLLRTSASAAVDAQPLLIRALGEESAEVRAARPASARLNARHHTS